MLKDALISVGAAVAVLILAIALSVSYGKNGTFFGFTPTLFFLAAAENQVTEVVTPVSARDYLEIAPLVEVLEEDNPSWFTPDLTVFRLLKQGDFYRLDLGYDNSDRHALFKWEKDEYVLLDGGLRAVPCKIVEENNIPTDLSGACR